LKIRKKHQKYVVASNEAASALSKIKILQIEIKTLDEDKENLSRQLKVAQTASNQNVQNEQIRTLESHINELKLQLDKKK